ncbi:probable chitinase 10 [Belonocnema kinseyi]|uniref:probable chitinase 10 n=1 Tax=Belonocnema kinseyi TaxID=2817044 RepID=UPI00143D949A|nr:probable chitinase 10 [Belonocnema kinseyi]
MHDHAGQEPLPGSLHLQYYRSSMMYKVILFLGICWAFASGSKPLGEHAARLPVADNKCQKIINCYYTYQGDEQIDETLDIEMINVSLCTNLFYSLANIEKDASIQITDEYTDLNLNAFRRINALRKKNRRLKTLVAMQDSIWDSPDKNNKNKILFDPTLREKLVGNIVNFVEKYKFNGIDLQSQYLTQENTDDSDKQNFVLLLKALKEKFDKKGFILSLAVEGIEATAKKYDIKEMSKYVSFINLRTYNLHGDLYTNGKILKSGHLAPLYNSSKENTEDRKLNVDSIVKYWISKGAPTKKLILGTTFKGMSYTHGRIKTFRAEYAKSIHLAGVFVDSIEQDDFNGHCGGVLDTNSIIERKAEFSKHIELGGVVVDNNDGYDFIERCKRIPKLGYCEPIPQRQSNRV